MWGKDFQPDEHTLVVKAAEDAAYLPTVDVFLPVCNEDIALLNNTWEHVKAMDYPSYTVFVLDDGAKDDVRDLAAEHGFQCEEEASSTFFYIIFMFYRTTRMKNPTTNTPRPHPPNNDQALTKTNRFLRRRHTVS